MSQPHPAQLTNAITTHRHLRLTLAREFPDADEETLTDTLEGISDLPEMIAQVVRSSLADRDMAAALKARISDMASRLARLNERADRKRKIAAEAMRSAGLKKILEPDLTLSIRPVPPAITITDESLIPQEYWLPQPPKLNRKDLRDVVLSGCEVPGVETVNQAQSLSVRAK